MSDISRVVMLWPADLKAEIQAEVGKRGLTQYVLQAVREKRGIQPPPPVQTPVPLAQVRALPDIVAKCSSCDAELNPDGTCWVCG
jgi:hypothetical protein